MNHFWVSLTFASLTTTLPTTTLFYFTEQSFFEKVKQLAQCQDEFLSQTQEHLKLKEEFAKLGKNSHFYASET